MVLLNKGRLNLSREAQLYVLVPRSYQRSRLTESVTETPIPQGIFGVPLQVSIRYANVAISLFDADGQSFIYGYVPIVVAKCGVFLKEKGSYQPSSFYLIRSKY